MEVLDKKAFRRELWGIMFPVAVQSLLSSLVSASDALMLGFLDQSSLSAISLATQVAFVLSLFHMSFQTGASVLAAQYWGIKDAESVEKVLGLSLRCSLPVSLVFFAAALLFPQVLMRVFTPDPALIELGVPYLRIVSVSYLIMGFTQMYLNIMKNTGRVGKSSLIGSVTVVSNIVLNFLLIFGLFGLPKMGISGAALATVISRVIELLLCVFEDFKPSAVRFRAKFVFARGGELAHDFFRYMTPVFLNYLVWGGGVTMFSVILGHLGSDAVAANSITNILKNLLLSFCTGIGAGSGIMVGNRLGAGKLEEAKACAGEILKYSVIFGAAAGAVLLLLIPLATRMPSLTDTARGYLGAMMAMSSYCVIGKSLNSTMISGIFTAGGDTRFGFLCDLINMWVFIIPVSSIAAFVFHAPVLLVYFLLNLDEICKIPFEIHHYRKYGWLKNLTNKAG